MYQNVPKLPEKHRFRTVPFVAVRFSFHYRIYRVSLPLIYQNQLGAFRSSSSNRHFEALNRKIMNFPLCYVHKNQIFGIRRKNRREISILLKIGTLRISKNMRSPKNRDILDLEKHRFSWKSGLFGFWATLGCPEFKRTSVYRYESFW